MYSQIDKPECVFANQFFSSPKQLALVVRLDQGIDSIVFPVDTTLLKMHVKKLDINGKTVSPQKVYYEYRFTPLTDTVYKLPPAILWSDNKSFDIIRDKYVRLYKPRIVAESSETETDGFVPFASKSVEYKRFSREITSRISKNIAEQMIVLWASHIKLKVNDTFRIVIESNADFDRESVTINDMEGLSDKIKVISKETSAIYNNGYEKHYIRFICKAVASGKLKIKPLKIKTDHKIFETNIWELDIME